MYPNAESSSWVIGSKHLAQRAGDSESDSFCHYDRVIDSGRGDMLFLSTAFSTVCKQNYGLYVCHLMKRIVYCTLKQKTVTFLISGKVYVDSIFI